MHEIGHAIGLDHSVSRASLMYPTLVTHFSEVPQQDVEKIQLKYGKRQKLKTTEIPTFCEVPKYDAVLYHQNKLVIIAGKYCYKKFKPGSQPTLLSKMWPGAPGDQVWDFKDARLQEGYPRKIHETFPGLPRNLDDAVYDKQKYFYAFKKDHYWRYNTVNKNVDRSDDIEDYGVSGPIDAALIDNDKKRLFFFKDRKILDEIGFNSTNDGTDDIGLRFFAGANTRILHYQQQHGLKETGELDRETKISLQSPKCGMSNVAAHGEDYKWSSRYLTYYVRNTPWGIPSRTVKNLIRNAFDEWSKVTNLEFAESNDPESDMEIAFGGRRHTNRESICNDDLGANTLAHAYYPQIGGIHFNTQFFHAAMDKDQFFTTAMHEIGHALGLDHSVSKASVMYPTVVAHFSEVPKQDVERIQLKYGKRQELKTTGLPTFCEVTKYDAAMYYQNKLVIIAGKYCYTNFNDRDEPTLLSEMWPGAPGKAKSTNTDKVN
ncbi:hypothetical protein RP20_CCG002176 [Aedes albopictus]|nr:hypothetical protein RP20_CCG002176 [Aedes albopictus]